MINNNIINDLPEENLKICPVDKHWRLLMYQ